MRVVTVTLLGIILSASAPDRLATPSLARLGQARSFGSPNDGRLDGGARLTEATYLRVVPFYADSQARWGLPSLVGLLDRAARRVSHRFANAVLSVGDLSRRQGGVLERHRSHESGRDADVGFYLLRADSKPLLAPQFLPIAADGKAPGIQGAKFDEPRNWALVEALVDDPEARVSHIFVASHLRARLLRYAEVTGVSPVLRERAAVVMRQPRRSLPHDDHFHVRISCPETTRDTCVEDAVFRGPKARPPVVHARKRTDSDPSPPSASQNISTGQSAAALKH